MINPLYRKLRPDDLPVAFSEFRSSCGCPLPDRSELEPVWKLLCERSASLSFAVEEKTEEGRCPLAFYLLAFITDRSAAWIKQNATRRAELYLTGTEPGCPRAILNHAEIARANSGDGLILFTTEMLFHRRLWEDGRLMGVWRAVDDWAGESMKGHNIKEIIHSASCAQGRERAWAFGLRDIPGKEPNTPGWPGEAGPFVLTFSQEQGLNPETLNATSRAFIHYPPRFYFPASEKEALLEAVRGHSDEEIAERARVTPEAIKQRFKRAYARVRRVDPLFFTNGGSGGHRNCRSLLVNHLRHRMEELRPHVRPRRSVRAGP